MAMLMSARTAETDQAFPHLVRSVPAARAINAVKVYGDADTCVRALDGVDVEFAPGQFTAIMGPSGSGKSTLLHLAGGLDSPTSGSVFVEGRDLAGLSPADVAAVRRRSAGYVFQDLNLIPALTALENVSLPRELDGVRGRQARAEARAALDELGVGDLADRFPDDMSGGQQQRVAIARALASRPQIIFADEPTGNLDSRAGAEVLGFTRTAVDDMGQTVVMVTHDPVAAGYADRVLFLADGRVVDEMLQPTAERVLERMKRFGE